MAHLVETMAYAGEVPWHGLGKRVHNDLTPEQMLKEAGIDWKVEMTPTFALIDEDLVQTSQSALVRSSDKKILDIVSNDWHPVQNQEAFEFFNDFVMSGDMEMHTAGSLRDGQIVWGLAKVKESFELFGGDVIESFLLFSNFHKYGCSTDVRFTPIRVVCNNTLTLSLSSKVERMARFSHRQKFNPEDAKEMLGIAAGKLSKYKEMAEFLGSKRYTGETLSDYFDQVFPMTTTKDEDAKVTTKEKSRNAKKALEIISGQPGAEYAEGSWWQAFNATTYMVDHVLGRNVDNRMTNAWFGSGRKLKNDALELAIEYADAA